MIVERENSFIISPGWIAYRINCPTGEFVDWLENEPGFKENNLIIFPDRLTNNYTIFFNKTTTSDAVKFKLTWGGQI